MILEVQEVLVVDLEEVVVDQGALVVDLEDQEEDLVSSNCDM